MLTTSRISRLAEFGEYDRLLTAVLANGRELPLSARVRLSQPEALTPAALGLGLLRLLELTHRRREPVTEHVVCALLEEQDGSGRFGNLASTAVALSALSAFLGGAGEGGAALHNAEWRERLEDAIARGLHALYCAQQREDDGGGLIGDEIDSALMLWLLGRDERFGRAVDVPALLSALEGAGGAREAAVGAILSLAGGRGALVRSQRAQALAA